MIINTKADLDAAPQEVQDVFMAKIAAGLYNWQWIDGQWVLVGETAILGPFGFTVADFPDAPKPEKPDYNPDEREAQMRQTNALKTIETFARDVRHQIAGTHDDAEIAGWNNKLRIAKAVLDKTATESEIQAMATEAQARGDGKTAEELAAIVVAKGEKFAVVVGLIDGMKRKAEKAVEAAKTPAEVEAVLDAMRKEADAALEQLKG